MGQDPQVFPRRLLEAFDDIIEGRNVKRTRHNLLWNGRDESDRFALSLQEKGYHYVLVREVEVQPGERVPAFFLREGVAHFGWIFWEKFSDKRLRKLFGSVVRNSKGDWEIQIPEKKNTRVYANRTLKREMDIDHPSGIS